MAGVKGTVDEMTELAAGYGRELVYGLRAHVIVRETEAEARAAARRLVSKLDDDTGAAIRGKSLDAASRGVAAPVGPASHRSSGGRLRSS